MILAGGEGEEGWIASQNLKQTTNICTLHHWWLHNYTWLLPFQLLSGSE